MNLDRTIKKVTLTYFFGFLGLLEKLLCALSLQHTDLQSQICTSGASDVGAPNDRFTPV